MNKIRLYAVTVVLLSLLSVVCSCSSSLDELPQVIETDPSAPIELTTVFSGQEDVDIPTRAGAVTTPGAGTNLNISLFRADEVYGTTYTGGPFAGSIVGGSPATISTGQYYQSDPTKKTKLIGIYPAIDGTGVTWDAGGRTVTYSGATFAGITDILCSALTEGSKNTPMAAMTFSHVLTQIKINIQADAAAVGKWGNVNSISLVGKKQDYVVTLPVPNTTGSATAAGSGAATNLAVTTDTGGAVTPIAPTASPVFFGQAMIPPITSGTFDLSIVTASDGTWTKPVTSQPYIAGQSYLITLTFKVTGIEITSTTIAPWGSGSPQNIDII